MGLQFSLRRLTLSISMRILVCSNDRLGQKRAGPATRALEITSFLASHTQHSISLIGPGEDVDLPAGVDRFTPQHLLGMLRLYLRQDVIIAPSFKLSHLLLLYFLPKTVVLDGYDPVPLEILEQHREAPIRKKKFLQYFHTQVLNLALGRADVVLCASERQRHWYIGLLSALGRIDPVQYPDDPKLDRLIQLVPFGLPEQAPEHKKQVLKGVVPGILEDDFVLLWGGGIWNWFDPFTLIQAVQVLHQRLPKIKLYFLGIQHPNPLVPEMKKCTQAIDLAKSLGLYGTTIFFNEGWTPFEQRQNYLLESDLGLSIHEDHLESEFSFRTRLLDYIWAQLPLVVTDGDVWSEIVREKNIGFVVGPKDVEQLAEIISHAYSNRAELQEIKQRLLSVRQEFTWSRTLQPLMTDLESPVGHGTHLTWRKRVCLSLCIVWVAGTSLLHWSYFKV